MVSTRNCKSLWLRSGVSLAVSLELDLGLFYYYLADRAGLGLPNFKLKITPSPTHAHPNEVHMGRQMQEALRPQANVTLTLTHHGA